MDIGIGLHDRYPCGALLLVLLLRSIIGWNKRL